MPAADPQRIAKLLARAGIASRREVERMIAEGRVAKDGVVLDTPATVLGSLKGVTVDGQPVEAPEPARLFLYHKPPGLLVTERDPGGRPTIYDRLPAELPRVVPVGRLDLSTEGLLLLTTDGGLKRQLELPATGVERAYRARAYGAITQAQLEELIEGVEIDGIRYGSINANLERRTGANVWIELILTEGKNREVRRVLEHLGLRVSRLIRTRYGPFVLGDLPPGEVGEVRRHDVESFRKHPTRVHLPQPARGRSGGVATVGREASVTRPTPATGARARPVGAVPTRAERPDNRAAERTRGEVWSPARQAPSDERRAARPARPHIGVAGAEGKRGSFADRGPAPAREGERTVKGPHPSRSGESRSAKGDGPKAGRGHASGPRREPSPARSEATSARGPATRRPAKPSAARTAPQHPPRPPRDDRPSPVANPVRAARAKAHRDATGRPDPAIAPARPEPNRGRPRPPLGTPPASKGPPRGAKPPRSPRPPRTRK